MKFLLRLAGIRQRNRRAHRLGRLLKLHRAIYGL
jgi:hypothetical protein